ncbi:MAG: PepSY domain-containing protein [Candidatus Tectimicrobiota bacterium]
MRRYLFLAHRYLGMATCLCVAMWFSTGIVMMYVGFPDLTPAERWQGLAPLALHTARVLPAQALTVAGVEGWPQYLGLEMVFGRPAYVIASWNKDPWRTVFADDGSLLSQVEAAQAVAAAERFVHTSQAHERARGHYRGVIMRDQWTVNNNLDRLRPLHHIAFDDPAGTEVYVSDRTGTVVRDTTRYERGWNWCGAVLHWVYFTALRQERWLWRQVVLWLAGVCIVTTGTGVVVGLLRWRPRARYRQGSTSPYHGVMRWHHVLGLLAAVPLSTWMVSGWLSLTPGDWVSDDTPDRAAYERYLGIDAPRRMFTSPPVALAQGLPPVKEARLQFWNGEPVYLLSTSPTQRWLVRADEAGTRVMLHGREAVLPAARRLLPEARIIQTETLQHYDFYWYAHHTPRPLPIWRVIFDDPQRTWFHIDPDTGEILEQMDASRRLNRMLFNALHSLDFPWLLALRPLWDGLLIVLCTLGFSLSVTAVVIAWRRLRYHSRVWTVDNILDNRERLG